MEDYKKTFFYKNWWLFYLLFFLLLGILIYSLLWKNNARSYLNEIAALNKDLQECRDTPPVQIESPPPETPPVIVDCNTTVNSGGQGVTETEHRLGSAGGAVLLEYDALTIPDEFTIIYNGQIVASTNGLVSDYGSLTWTYYASPGNPEYCTVKVSAPRDNTRWTYRLNCPVP